MRKLQVILKKQGGRDQTGQVAVRHQGGGHKQFIRIIDFKRDKDVSGKVVAIEYDPNRTCDIALINYTDGEKRYILAPDGLEVGQMVSARETADIKPGNNLPLGKIPLGTAVHNIELTRGKGGQLARSAGVAGNVAAYEGEYVHIRMPSGEVRRIHAFCRATIGQVGNITWKDRVVGKAGTSRHLGIRPTVRGVAQNPRSHPHGGGEGRSGIGMSTPKTYAGRAAVGRRRNKKKFSNKYIVQRRKK